jgi:hypothetical protein
MCIAHLSAHLCILSAYSEILDVSFYLNYVTPSYNNTEIFLWPGFVTKTKFNLEVNVRKQKKSRKWKTETET